MSQPAGRFPQRLGLKPEPVLPSANAPLDQSRALEHFDVLRDAVERDGKLVGQASDLDLAPGEGAQNRPARAIRDGPVDLVEFGFRESHHA